MTTATRAPGAGIQAAEIYGITPDTTAPPTPQARGRLLHRDRPGPLPRPSAPARTMRSWPLLILAMPAAVAVWSGWVGIGQLTGFGQIHPLPGIWDSLHLNTAVTLPVGVEAYAAYALRAWLTASQAVSDRTRRFARRSATGSLMLGMGGQAGYHLLAQAGMRHAPGAVTIAVSCLPVLVLGMGAALAHLLHADAHRTTSAKQAGPSDPNQAADPADHMVHVDHEPDDAPPAVHAGWMAEAQAAAVRLAAAAQHVSRRSLRAAGLHGSNAALGQLARILTPQPQVAQAEPDGHNPASRGTNHAARPRHGQRTAGWSRAQPAEQGMSP